MNIRTVESLERHVDYLVSELGDRSLRGDVWLATLLLAQVEPEHFMADMNRGLPGDDQHGIERLRRTSERVSDGLEALGRLLDHAEAKSAKRMAARAHHRREPSAGAAKTMTDAAAASS
jgi:hypothetical protein